MRVSFALCGAGIAALTCFASVFAFGEPESSEQPYKVVSKSKVGGAGGFDYVFADSEGRRLYIPRSGGPNSRVTVFDLDTLKPVGEITKTSGVHGVAVAPKSHHGITSSKPVVILDTTTLATITTVQAECTPDGTLLAAT